MSNHVSYIDVFALGSVFLTQFAPKSDVAKWPIIGFLTNLSLPVYIDRKGGKNIKNESLKIASVINNGRNVILFPEATSSNGAGILPFKSSFFALAEDFPIIPVAINYRKVNGKPIDDSSRDKVAWYGEMEFLPHFWGWLKLKSIECDIYFAPELTKDNADRKQLAATCQTIVQGLGQQL